MHEIIAAPFLGNYLLLRPGRPNGVKIPRPRYAELATAQACPAWLADAAQHAWNLDLSGRPVTGTVLIRPEPPSGYAPASYRRNPGCNSDSRRCHPARTP